MPNQFESTKTQLGVEVCLRNDKYSTDEELIEHFVKAGPIERKEIDFFVSQEEKLMGSIDSNCR